MIRYRGYSARPFTPPDGGSPETPGTIDGRDASRDLGYQLISIDPVRAPADCVGGDWHIYRISQGENGITGYRRGDVASVRKDVETIVAALNERRQTVKGKEPSKSRSRAPVLLPAAAK